MKKTVVLTGFGLLLVLSTIALPQIRTRQTPDWAFPVIQGSLPAEPPGQRKLPGSTRTFPSTQIDDLMNPPDWFPEEHAPAPQIVKFGHGDALEHLSDPLSIHRPQVDARAVGSRTCCSPTRQRVT